MTISIAIARSSGVNRSNCLLQGEGGEKLVTVVLIGRQSQNSNLSRRISSPSAQAPAGVSVHPPAPGDRPPRPAASVRRTSKVLIAREDAVTFGLGGEIAAQAADELFPWLDGPVRRAGANELSTSTSSGESSRMWSSPSSGRDAATEPPLPEPPAPVPPPAGPAGSAPPPAAGRRRSGLGSIVDVSIADRAVAEDRGGREVEARTPQGSCLPCRRPQKQARAEAQEVAADHRQRSCQRDIQRWGRPFLPDRVPETPRPSAGGLCGPRRALRPTAYRPLPPDGDLEALVSTVGPS